MGGSLEDYEVDSESEEEEQYLPQKEAAKYVNRPIDKAYMIACHKEQKLESCPDLLCFFFHT